MNAIPRVLFDPHRRRGQAVTAREELVGAANGNYELLENGEEYFPAVFAAIAAARHEVLIETFILFEDAVGNELRKIVVAAARRGVSIDLTIDDYGSPNLSEEFVESLTAAGVRLHVYDPRPRLFGLRTNMFRRLHRKIVAIDGRVAFIGGINFSEDHLSSYGAEAKQDYAVRIEGALADEIRDFARRQVDAYGKSRWKRELIDTLQFGLPRLPRDAWRGKSASLIYRDNERHRDDIERAYRIAIRAARHEVVIACAYFFPGYRLLRQLRHAARRGVSVKLILQGAPDVPQAKTWAQMLYPSLLDAGVEIHEYCLRPLHAKVAVIDDRWSTIGSSNLDPSSLALNLEANVVIRDADFCHGLRRSLEPLIVQHCRQVSHEHVPKGSLWQMLSNVVSYHATRHFPRWAGWLPLRRPRLYSVEPRHVSDFKHRPHGLEAHGDRGGH